MKIAEGFMEFDQGELEDLGLTLIRSSQDSTHTVKYPLNAARALLSKCESGTYYIEACITGAVYDALEDFNADDLTDELYATEESDRVNRLLELRDEIVTDDLMQQLGIS